MSKCFVTKITDTSPIDGADRIHLATVMNEQVIVSKAWEVGMIGLFFPTETKISQGFLYHNNLYRHSELNADTSKKGFFDDTGRVKYQTLRGERSEGFFCEVSSLSYLGNSVVSLLRVGNVFNSLEGRVVCSKYISYATQSAKEKKKGKKASKYKMSAAGFLEHKDTAQLKHYIRSLKAGALLSISNKIHGTSFRCSHTEVTRQDTTCVYNFSSYLKSKGPRLVSKRNGGCPGYKSVKLPKTKGWEFVSGSRRVLLDQGRKKVGYCGSNAFRYEVTNVIKPHLEKGMTVYGEIYGFVNGKAIIATHKTKKVGDKAFQEKYGPTIQYSYGCSQQEFKFMIYRISAMNADGVAIDYTNSQLQAWCSNYGFEAPQMLCEPFIYDGDAEVLLKRVTALGERTELLGEDYKDPSHPCEGVVVRSDYKTLVPKLLKYKNSWFRMLEGLSNDVDLEDAS